MYFFLIVFVDNKFEELSREYEFDITAVYLGSGIDLDFIYYDIDEYREYMKEKGSLSLDDMKQYPYRS